MQNMQLGRPTVQARGMHSLFTPRVIRLHASLCKARVCVAACTAAPAVSDTGGSSESADEGQPVSQGRFKQVLLHVPLPAEQVMSRAMWTPASWPLQQAEAVEQATAGDSLHHEPPAHSSAAATQASNGMPPADVRFKGVVERVLFPSAENPSQQKEKDGTGYAVLRARVDQETWGQLLPTIQRLSPPVRKAQPPTLPPWHPQRRASAQSAQPAPSTGTITVAGKMRTPPPQEQEQVYVEGRWAVHASYGLQVVPSFVLEGDTRPNMEDVAPIDLVSFKTAITKLKAGDTSRTTVTLSATDLTAAEWCGLQLAYQVASGERKKQTVAMAKGSAIHEDIELEVVEKVPVLPSSKEDVQAVSLVSCIAAIRQLVTEGETRELRIFGKLRGQWMVGVIDGLQLDPAAGLVSMMETKTRHSPGLPEESQQRSAKMQVMIYRELYNAFRTLSEADICEYLFHVSSSGVGLQPDAPLGPDLLNLCQGLFPEHGDNQQQQQGNNQQQQQQQQEQQQEVAQVADHLTTSASPTPAKEGSITPTGPVSTSVVQQPESSSASHEVVSSSSSSSGGGGEAGQKVTLRDCVRLLHASLSLLPPPGYHHHIEYIGQKDKEVIGTVDVQFDPQQFEMYLTNALNVWQGKEAPMGVRHSQDRKCKRCDFRKICREWADTTDSVKTPSQLAAQTMETMQQKFPERYQAIVG